MAGAFTGQVKVFAAIDTDSAVFSTTYTSDSKPCHSQTMLAGIAGTLTTRTSDTQGVVTSTSHGKTASDTIALFWDGGFCYDCDITSVTDNTITFTAASGDALPAVGTGDPPAVVIAEAQDIDSDVSINGTNLQMIFVKVTTIASDCLVVLYDGASNVFDTDEIHATQPYIWPKTADEARPFTETADKIRFYNGTTTAGRIDLFALL